MYMKCGRKSMSGGGADQQLGGNALVSKIWSQELDGRLEFMMP